MDKVEEVSLAEQKVKESQEMMAKEKLQSKQVGSITEPQPQMSNPNLDMAEGEQVQQTQYDEDFVESSNALEKSFYLRGMENRGTLWQMRTQLEEAYASRQKLPMYQNMSLFQVFK